jgi:hypothetical protein
MIEDPSRSTIHHLIKTIKTVPSVGDVRGVAVSAVTGRLYVAYQDISGVGMVYW